MSVSESRRAFIAVAIALMFSTVSQMHAGNGVGSYCDDCVFCDGCTPSAGCASCDVCDGCDGCTSCGGCDGCGSSFGGGGCGLGCCWDQRSHYAALRLGASFNRLESGGLNTLGPHQNTGSDDDESFDIGGAIGLKVPNRHGAIRLECEALSRDMFQSVTGSFQPPTPTFFYQVDYTDRWSAMGNVWFDLDISDRLGVYAGGGLGVGGGRISLTDGVVQGRDSFSEFAWQAGGGLIWHCSDCFDVDLGYRYVDYGTATVALSSVFGNAPAGAYDAELTSHQIMLSLQFNKLGDLVHGLRKCRR